MMMSQHRPPRAPPKPLGGSPGPPLGNRNSSQPLETAAAAVQQQASSLLTGGGSVSSSSLRCPPGWTRFVNHQGHVVYRTALGHEIHNAKQLRDFLLSDVTCKCGLPCPLIIDKWFDFSSPNSNGVTSSSVLVAAAASAAAMPSMDTSSSVADTVTSSNLQSPQLVPPHVPLPRELTLDDGRRQLDRRKALPSITSTAAHGIPSIGMTSGTTRKKASVRRGPYEGLLVSQLLAKQKSSVNAVCASSLECFGQAEMHAQQTARKNAHSSADGFVKQNSVSTSCTGLVLHEQNFLTTPVMPRNPDMQTSQSTITPVVTEANVECFSRCLTATMAYNESHTATSTGLITEKLDHVSSPPSQHRQQHPHLIQTDGADKKAMILPSNLELQTGRDQQQPLLAQRQQQQQPLLVATVDASQIYQQPLQVYCSPTTGPTAHAGTGILLSPQQSAELVLQNNINSIGNMNNLAAAAANISSLNGQAAMNGIVNSMMQHHNNHTVNAVNHLNNLNASVSSISSAQVLLSASAPQLLTYSSVLNPLPVPNCPTGVSPITVLGVSSSIPPISIVGVGPPQQLPLSQMPQQMHTTLQLQNHPQLLSPPQTTGPRPNQTQVTTGGTIVMTAGPYCGPPVGSTTVNTVTLDGTATASVNVNDFGPGVRRVQHAQCSQYTPPMPAGTTPIVRQQQTQLNVSLPLAGDTSQSVSTGSSDSAENCPPCPPTCATVQLYNVTALTGDGSGGMGTVLLQTTPQASAPVPATYGSAPVPSTCSAVE
ncbi:uncharacterized protein LOC111254425 isoform X2 [Varroa destructor]|uniref:MBD domain-containing protein n=1 Tax=Varroa destructor TaxID=109461 RepID=A0A7M7KUG9_VARDE|nr:uncharacterized protein LOC111254425 isoform X2 [Varroa destructor]